jgi:NADH:ubiquinone oxidoreductase subunit 2 (subunit N)
MICLNYSRREAEMPTQTNQQSVPWLLAGLVTATITLGLVLRFAWKISGETILKAVNGDVYEMIVIMTAVLLAVTTVYAQSRYDKSERATLRRMVLVLGCVLGGTAILIPEALLAYLIDPTLGNLSVILVSVSSFCLGLAGGVWVADRIPPSLVPDEKVSSSVRA